MVSENLELKSESNDLKEENMPLLLDTDKFFEKKKKDTPLEIIEIGNHKKEEEKKISFFV